MCCIIRVSTKLPLVAARLDDADGLAQGDFKVPSITAMLQIGDEGVRSFAWVFNPFYEQWAASKPQKNT